MGLAAKQDRRSMADDDDARLDADIVELFADKGGGWEFLTMLPDDALARLRELQRRGKLDKAALVDLWNRYSPDVPGNGREGVEPFLTASKRRGHV